MKRDLQPHELIERSIIKKFRKTIWNPFTLAVPAERLRTSPALYSYEAPVAEPFTLRLIPYFAWANRGRGDMQVWFL